MNIVFQAVPIAGAGYGFQKVYFQYSTNDSSSNNSFTIVKVDASGAEPTYLRMDDSSFKLTSQHIYLDGNVGVGTGGAGASATNTVIVKRGVAPTTSPADCAQMWVADFVAGDARFYMRTEGGVTTQVAGLGLANTWTKSQKIEVQDTGVGVDLLTLYSGNGLEETLTVSSYAADYYITTAGTGDANLKVVAGGEVVLNGAAGNRSAGSLLVGASASVGTSGVRVLAVQSGTAPTTSPADCAQMWVADFAAGDARFYMRTEGGVTTEVAGLGLANTWSASQTFNENVAVFSTKTFGFADGTVVTRPASNTFRFAGGGGGMPADVSLMPNTPAQLVADQNDYSPGAGFNQRWSSDASRSVTGMVAGSPGIIRYIWNVGNNNIVFSHENASSSSGNRFLTSSGADLTLPSGRCAMAMYDNSSTRWRVALLS